MIDELLLGFQRHIRILQGLTEASVHLYSAKVLEFVSWLNSSHPGKEITSTTRRDLEAYLEHCFYKGNGNTTRLTKLIALTKFFRWLRYEGKIADDVTSDVPKIRRRPTFVQKFTKAEVLRIFSCVDILREKGLRDASIFILAAFCGLRAGEIAGLALQDLIDEEGKSLDIHLVGKFGTHRQIYLWKAPSEILRRWLSVRLSHGSRAHDPLFVSYHRGDRHTATRLTISTLDQLVKVYSSAAGVRKAKISMHMFRATHASDLRHVQGYDTPAIAERLGHRSIATTDKYIPTRGRIHRVYPSLAAYWREFTTLWTESSGSPSPSAVPTPPSTIPPGGDTGA